MMRCSCASLSRAQSGWGSFSRVARADGWSVRRLAPFFSRENVPDREIIRKAAHHFVASRISTGFQACRRTSNLARMTPLQDFVCHNDGLRIWSPSLLVSPNNCRERQDHITVTVSDVTCCKPDDKDRHLECKQFGAELRYHTQFRNVQHLDHPPYLFAYVL